MHSQPGIKAPSKPLAYNSPVSDQLGGLAHPTSVLCSILSVSGVVNHSSISRGGPKVFLLMLDLEWMMAHHDGCNVSVNSRSWASCLVLVKAKGTIRLWDYFPRGFQEKTAPAVSWCKLLACGWEVIQGSVLLFPNVFVYSGFYFPG